VIVPKRQRRDVLAEPPIELNVTTKPLPRAATGLAAVMHSLQIAIESEGLMDATRAMRKINQRGGFDCSSCSWADPQEGHKLFDFCEKRCQGDGGRRDAPTLIAMHHPPFDTGIAPVDAHPLRGRDELAALIAAHPQVVRLIGGHIHRACEVPFGGTIASTAPSTAHQLIVDRGTSGAYALRVERPAFALHRWTGRALVTSICSTTETETSLRAVS
jgi:hypothetical protein